MNDSVPTSNEPIESNLVKDDPSFADLVEQFVEGLGGRVTAMEDALNGSDFDALRTAAHQLKGCGGGYGYPILTERAAELEQFARKQALENCEKSFEQVRALCSRVVVSAEA